MENKSIGGLWKQTSESGKKYLSGIVELGGTKYSIAVFANEYKEPDSKQPDFRILLRQPKAPAQAVDAFADLVGK